MPKIKVLVVDDSSLARMVLIEHLTRDKDIEIVGVAGNGKEALRKVKYLKPSIVTMDINMPVMGGLETIEQIMAYNPVPVLVVTSRADAETAYAAIAKGALEIIRKPDVDTANSRELIRKVKLLAGVRVITHVRGRQGTERKKTRVSVKREKTAASPGKTVTEIPKKAVAIASSTGGPKTLARILQEIPANLPMPVFVAQHIPPDFVSGLTEWLDSVVSLIVKIGEDGERIRSGTVYISPADKNMVVSGKNRIILREREPGSVYAPSCDLMISSVAGVYKRNALGIILTGMGKDGVGGLADIRQKGGKTIAQDKETSIVYGMPKVAAERGLADRILKPEDIIDEIIEFGGMD